MAADTAGSAPPKPQTVKVRPPAGSTGAGPGKAPTNCSVGPTARRSEPAPAIWSARAGPGSGRISSAWWPDVIACRRTSPGGVRQPGDSLSWSLMPSRACSGAGGAAGTGKVSHGFVQRCTHFSPPFLKIIAHDLVRARLRKPWLSHSARCVPDYPAENRAMSRAASAGSRCAGVLFVEFVRGAETSGPFHVADDPARQVRSACGNHQRNITASALVTYRFHRPVSCRWCWWR